MAQDVSIEADAHRGAALLADVSSVIWAMNLLPQSLIWSMDQASGEARMWMIFNDDEARLPSLVFEIHRIPGVRIVAPHPPGENFVRRLAPDG
jgi:hypothetical protein